MKILSQKKEKNMVYLEIEADYASFQASFEKAMIAAGKEIRISGFRPGKAPRHILESSLNTEAVESRAAQDLISELYPVVVTESKIDPIAYPSVEIVQQEKDKPFIFKLTVDVYPEIKLGKHKGIKLTRRSAEVAEAEVLAALGRLQERVSVAGPDGKKELLPLDDEFAGKVSNFGTLAELKEEVRKALHDEKKAEADADLHNQAIAAAGAEAKVELPLSMIERETDIMLDELKASLAQSGLTLEQYLLGAKKGKKALRDELKKSAEIRVKGKLVLQAVAAAEKIEVTPEDMTAEIKAMAASYGEQAESAEQQLNENGRAYIKDYLLRKKALDWLVENASVKEVKTEEATS
jgi:FKBP-type peptidyl-prolyl cis-trans isomerase (trigger factor)